MRTSETKASCLLPCFALSKFPDFVISDSLSVLCPHRQIKMLRTHVSQYLFQSVLAARVTSDYICIAPLCLFYRSPHHLLGHRIRKEHDQIRTADLFTETCRHLCEDFCLAVESFAYLLILTYHSVMTAYDNNTHIKPPDDK